MDNMVMWEEDVIFIKLLFEMKILEQLRERVYFPDPHLNSVFFRAATCTLFDYIDVLIERQYLQSSRMVSQMYRCFRIDASGIAVKYNQLSTPNA